MAFQHKQLNKTKIYKIREYVEMYQSTEFHEAEEFCRNPVNLWTDRESSDSEDNNSTLEEEGVEKESEGSDEDGSTVEEEGVEKESEGEKDDETVNKGNFLSSTLLFILSFVPPLIRSSIYSFIHYFIYPVINPGIHFLIHPVILSFIHTFVN